MKSLSLALALCLSLSSAFAMDADYRCELEGGGVGFKVGTNAQTAKAWQTDPGEDEGLEIALTNFSTARCPGCYSFEGMVFDVKVKAKVTNFKLTYSLWSPEAEQWLELLKDVPCVRQQ